MAKKTVAEQTREAKQAAKKLEQEAERAEKAAEKLLGAASGRAADFMNFVREQGVIGLAVGLAIGTQAGATVKAIVEGFINPIVGFLVGSQEGLIDAKWNVIGPDSEEVTYWLSFGDRMLVVSWGAILSALITLLSVAVVIYFAVKIAKLDRLDKKKD